MSEQEIKFRLLEMAKQLLPQFASEDMVIKAADKLWQFISPKP